MGFAVFVHRPDSIYDDRPEQQYQFPRQYLSRVQSAVGDWVVYYEPTKAREARGYFAVARVAEVVPDPTDGDMYLAKIVQGTYLPFAMEVPFTVAGVPSERGLLNEEGRLSGRAQAAVRRLSPEDFNHIVTLGLNEKEWVLPRLVEAPEDLVGLGDNPQAPFEVDRERVPVLLTRAIRDRVFRKIVLHAYDLQCAVTGYRFLNGGGRAEVEAAHIRPVGANGPDIVQNGIALSGTAHWMFDRGLITIADDMSILISRHVNDRDGAESLINPTGKIIGPANPAVRPHPRYLAWHRENCFKV